jgi:hypothetical protein
MVYTYTPAGRLESEVREGQVWYSRYYGYNLDGSRAMVMRDDALNGTHWDMYGYDAASGRLASVQDVWTGEVYNFVWNPEGTLARWENNAPNGYARVFGYDEEGWLVKIERDYGAGGVQVAYEYGYNSDSARVWKRDVLNEQEYRYVCRIGCGGVPMRVYNRPMSGGRWNTLEEYMDAPTVRWYGTSAESFSDYPLLAGHWLSECASPPEGTTLYQDAFGLRVGGETAVKRAPEYLQSTVDFPELFFGYLYFAQMMEKDPYEGKKKVAKCSKESCCTDVESDMATCCPDGRAYCGPIEGYSVACGGGKPEPKPEPKPKPKPKPPFDTKKCIECVANCLIADPGDRSFGECWKKCVEKGDCGLKLGSGVSVGLTGQGFAFTIGITF